MEKLELLLEEQVEVMEAFVERKERKKEEGTVMRLARIRGCHLIFSLRVIEAVCGYKHMDVITGWADVRSTAGIIYTRSGISVPEINRINSRKAGMMSHS